MKSYLFLVRPWNVDFFLSLAELIEADAPGARILYWTMHSQAVEALRAHGKDVVFLPEAFAGAAMDAERVIVVDQQLSQRFQVNLSFLYHTERFQPSAAQASEFIGKQVAWLDANIPADSTLVSLTCEHFVYILAGYLNRLKGGRNLYSMPAGFPLNANVILQSPWELQPIRDEPLAQTALEEYRDSLAGDPKKTIHYMRERKGPALRERIGGLIRRITSPPPQEFESMFNYIRPARPTLADKLGKKRRIPLELDHLQLEQIRELAKSRKLFYFPLQMEPEMSILAYSPYYKCQEEVARLLSQSLDQGDLIVIKENPKMIGKRPKEYYQGMSALYNLRWIDPSVNSREVIRASHKVLAITGTATIEAAAMGRNSMIFGYPPFRAMLAEPSVAEIPLMDFKQQLYSVPTRDEIESALLQGWSEFSKAVFFGNQIPHFVDGKRTTIDTDDYATRFYQEVAGSVLR